MFIKYGVSKYRIMKINRTEKIKNKKLVIVGAGEFGEIAYEYFTDDSEYEVVAFAVEKKYRNKDILRNLPIIDFEELENIYPCNQYDVFIAITYVKLNRERTRLYNICKKLGYKCASYISSYSFVWKNVEIGENTFIFEDNTIQYNVKIGNNVILWSGNHVGHRSVINDNCWITSHVVISGFCEIGKNCFVGVNATMGDNIKISDDVILGAGAVAVKDLEVKAGVYVGNPARILEDRNSYKQFNVEKSQYEME